MSEEIKATEQVEKTEEVEATESVEATEQVTISEAAAVSSEETAVKVNESATAEANPMDSIEVPIIKVGDIIKGTVVSLHDKYALVDLNYKFNGILPIGEIANVFYKSISDAIHVGQEVECSVVSLDDEKESMRLSKKVIDKEKAWELVVEHEKNDSVFEVKIVEAVNRGLVADLGIRGFIPISQVGFEFVEDLTGYVGQLLPVKVKELDADNKKVILSHKAALDEQAKAERQKVFPTLAVGQEFDGTVDRIAEFGAFVKFGTIDGLVHISELSWDHVNKVEDVVKIGDQVRVQIIKIDPELLKVNLSIKSLQKTPWEQALESFSEGDVVNGVVKRFAEFGVFVQIAPGVEGLLHISEISHKHVESARQVLSENQEITVKIIKLAADKKRIGLSMKQLEEKPVDVEAELEADRAQIEANSNKQSLTQNLGDLLRSQMSKSQN